MTNSVLKDFAIAAIVGVCGVGLSSSLTEPSAFQKEYPSLSVEDAQKMKQVDDIQKGLLLGVGAFAGLGVSRRDP